MTRNIGGCLSPEESASASKHRETVESSGRQLNLALRGVPNALGLGGLDQRVCVVRQQEALGDEIVRGFLKRREVRILCRIAFLDGEPWIARRDALGFRGRERNKAALQIAHAVLEAVLATQIPARIGADRRLQEDGPNSGQVVAVCVDLHLEN